MIDPLHSTQSAVISALSRKNDLKTKELYDQITAAGQQVSLQNLYRLIGQMLDAQMLIKNKDKLSLSSLWISELNALTETVNTTYTALSKDGFGFPLRPGERKEFTAQSLMDLDPTWNHLMIRLAEIANSTDWYEYDAHNWYALGIPDIERRFYQSLAAQGIQCHLLQGGNTFLDRHTVVRGQNIETVLLTDSPFPTDGYILIICGDYIAECFFSESLTRHFAAVYNSVKSIDQFDADHFASLFSMKAKVKLVVRRSKAEAAKLRSTAQRYFD